MPTHFCVGTRSKGSKYCVHDREATPCKDDLHSEQHEQTAPDPRQPGPELRTEPDSECDQPHAYSRQQPVALDLALAHTLDPNGEPHRPFDVSPLVGCED